jgi:CRP-like cAMP-binding protein
MHHTFYKELITNSIEDDFEKKMLLVASIDILKSQTKLFITPLVSGLARIKYKYGDVIIRKGEPVNKFYILAEGELQVLLEERSRRKISAIGI